MKFKKYIFLFSSILLLSSIEIKASEECFEGTSRAIFKFNMGFDNAILEPIAKGYNKLPEPIKNGTSNFTSNIATLLSIPNHLLQGELKSAGHATGSFLINSTVGILGLGNPAGKMGLKNQKEDLGQTLGAYGVGGGCYFVLPILGPTTLRDSVGMIVDNNYLDAFARVTWHEREIKSISGNKLDFIGIKTAEAVDFRGDNMINFESFDYRNLLPVLSALFYAASMTITKYTSDKDDVNTQLYYFYLIALVLCGIIYVFMGNGQFNNTDFDPTTQFIFREWFTNFDYTWKFILFFGVAASIGFLCIFSAYIIASPSVVSLFEYSLIIMSMIPGYFLFNEIPSLRTLLGVICIISAGVYIYFREGVRKQYVASKIPTRR